MMKLSDKKTEVDDHTGDSGIGTGSGSAKYGTIDDWKLNTNHPPPGSLNTYVKACIIVTHFPQCKKNGTNL